MAGAFEKQAKLHHAIGHQASPLFGILPLSLAEIDSL
jgi:hypothetical protein